MAKMKTFAIDIEVRRTITVFVDARKAGGAVGALHTPEGWRNALRSCGDETLPFIGHKMDDDTMTIRKVREV